jgi:L-ascorbate metabolism protein UlaG (beta-lactamase superfamily)
MRMWISLLVAFAIARAALAQTPSTNEKKTISIMWLGHAVFDIVSPRGTHLLIDPFLTKNPATPAGNKIWLGTIQVYSGDPFARRPFR